MQNQISTQTNGNSERVQQAAQAKQAGAAYVMTPAIDVYEGAEELRVLVDLPGVAAEALSLDLDKEVLTLTANRAVGARERALTYKRRFSLPREVAAENISAKLEDGVLYLTLPKRAANKPRSIKVSNA
jgi:HSP20 family molecular chaperone IbpA